jgi:hypothetical protein
MNHTTMLGTYSLDGNVPVEPEIVLSNCRDTAMLGRLVGMFADSDDVRFFLVHDIDPNTLDLGADFHFVKDSGAWVLANDDTMIKVLFDDTSFNPSGPEETFSLVHLHDGSWSVDAHADLSGADLPGADLPDAAGDHLLVDSEAHDIFVGDHVVHADEGSGSIFIDPSVMQDGNGEIVVTNFVMGQDTLELPEDMVVRDVTVDGDHNLTELIIGQQDGPDGQDDIVIKLLSALPDPGAAHSSAVDLDSGSDIDHLIQHIIDSPDNS